MDIHTEMANSIIRQQAAIIGPVALERARSIAGLTYDEHTKKVTLVGDSLAILDRLVEEYRVLFGQISVEVCKEAVSGLLSGVSADQVPASLK